MTSLVLFHGHLSDATTTLALQVRQTFDGACPIELEFDDTDTWSLSLDDAARLAAAGRRIEGAFDFAAQRGDAPKGEPFFRRKVEFGPEMVTFEVGISADPLGVYLEWAGKRVADKSGLLLRILSIVGESVKDVRRSRGP